MPGDYNDRTPERRKRGWPQGALKQATERTDGDREKKVTFVTGGQPVKRKPGRPKGSNTTTKDKTTITDRSMTFVKMTR